MAILKEDTYFKDPNNKVFFFDKGTSYEFIGKNLIKISEEEAELLLKPTLSQTKDYAKAKVKAQNKALENEIIFNGNIYKNNLNERLIVKELLDTYTKEVEFITKDNKKIIMDKRELHMLYNFMVRKNSKEVLKSYDLKQKINDCENEDEIKKLIGDLD